MEKTLEKIIDMIRKETKPDKMYRFMEFCGGHTYALARYAIPDVLPENIKMTHGPGCPVCVLPSGKIKEVLTLLSENDDVILCTYGDVLRVPDDEGNSLFRQKAKGADVRMVYSCLDALKIARDNQNKKIVFFAVGFETTAPLTAAAVLEAEQKKIKNFFVFSCHLYTPPAMQAILGVAKRLDGVIAPGHVLAVTGTDFVEKLAEQYKMPMVVSGFEAVDLLASILILVRLVNREEVSVKNEYSRVVTDEGNKKAMSVLREVFPVCCDFEWRGLGYLKQSGFAFGDKYKNFDAVEQFAVKPMKSVEHKACKCPMIIRGEAEPYDCVLFGKVCRPESPIGPCMVSGEGTCGAFFKYGRKQKN